MRPSILSPMAGGTPVASRLPFAGKSSPLRKSSQHRVAHAAAPSEVAPQQDAVHPEAAAAAQHVMMSDRAKISMLKSDVNLVQSEIDAFRGDPGGVLSIQGQLDKLQWSVDPVATSAVRDQLSALLLRKVNELAALCNEHCFQRGGGRSALLLPRNSFVSDVTAFFQARRLEGSSSRNLHNPPSAPKPPSSPLAAAPLQRDAPGSAQLRTIEAQPLLHQQSNHAAAASSRRGPSIAMAAEDPDDMFPIPPHRHSAALMDEVDAELHGGEERDMHSPVDDTSSAGGGGNADEVDDDVCWAPQQQHQQSGTRPPHPSADSPTKQKRTLSTELVTGKRAGDNSLAEKITNLTRQLAQTKAQLNFFKSFDKQLLLVNHVAEQLQLIAASPAVEATHTSLPKAIEVFYPQGYSALLAAAKSAAAASGATSSPASKKAGGRKDEAVATSATADLAAIPTAALLGQLIAGPLDDKKLRIAVAYQNAVIESITTAQSAQALEDRSTIDALKIQVSSLQKRLMAQQEVTARDRLASETAVQRIAVTAGGLSRVGTPATNLALTFQQSLTGFQSLPSRPLSRASVAESGGLVNFFGARAATPALDHKPPTGLLLPPRPNSEMALAELHRGGTAESHSGRAHLKPIVATRAEDIDGEKERRYLQVIRSQSEIIKDLSGKLGGRTAAASTTVHPMLQSPQTL